MAKRTITDTLGGMLVAGLGLALIAFGLGIMLIQEYPVQSALIAIAAFLFARSLKNRAARRRHQRFELARNCADRLIERHRGALLTYCSQSIRADLFGNEDPKLWRQHIGTFLMKQVEPELDACSIRLEANDRARLADHVDFAVRKMRAEALSSSPNDDIDLERLSGIDYEQHCKSILDRCGWTVRSTPVTGDHGADLIAEKGGLRLAVQCKFYSAPVGNKAVQEIYSAKAIYHCDHACVVAPNGFTAQAERAAHAHSIRLLHHEALKYFAEELSDGSAPLRTRSAAGL